MLLRRYFSLDYALIKKLTLKLNSNLDPRVKFDAMSKYGLKVNLKMKIDGKYRQNVDSLIVEIIEFLIYLYFL